MSFEKITIGKFSVCGLRDGFFYLDGGAMFGVVPKVLWERIFPSDRENRIRLGLNSLLIRTSEAVVLVETGIGSHLKKQLADYYSVEREPGLIGALWEAGFKPEDISFVINTHLHFDHCGGNTLVDDDGRIRPVFPRASYIIQKCEWDNAVNPSPRERPSYIAQYFAPLQEAGVLELVDGDKEITPGIEVVKAPGHTQCHQCVIVRSENETLFFLGDLVPTSGHVRLPYIMSYDLYPMETLDTKEKYFEQAIQEDWIVAFNHDPEHFFGKIAKKNGKYVFHPLHEK